MVIKKLKEFNNETQYSYIYYFIILDEIWVSYVVKDFNYYTYTVFLFKQINDDIYEKQFHNIPIDTRVLIEDLVEKCYKEINGNLFLVSKTRFTYSDFKNYFRLAKFDIMNV